MPANMTRIRQVAGMSTRESLNRPRLGASRWQGERVLDDRLNKAQLAGFEGPATTVYNRTSHGYLRQEKIFSKEQSAASIVSFILRNHPDWKPSRWARKEYRESNVMAAKSKLTAKGMLG